jgi:recombination associated protein RdgC
MVKNAIIYTPDDPAILSASLSDPHMDEVMQDRPCPEDLLSQQAEAFGWAPAMGDDFIVSIDQLHFIRLKKLERKLPQAAVKREIDKRIREMDREPNRQETRQIGENVVLEMLPGAPVVESYINAYFDERAGTFIILTSKESDADLMLDQLRQIGADLDTSFKMKRWMGENTISKMTHLVTEESDVLVDELRDWCVGDNAKLEDPRHGGKASFTGSDPLLDQIEEHIHEGMIVTELGLEIPDTVTFKVDSDLKIKSVKFGDRVSDEILKRQEQDALYEQSTLIIEAATMRRITNGVKTLFDITT